MLERLCVYLKFDSFFCRKDRDLTEVEKAIIESLSTIFNRSKNQQIMLFKLCDYDVNKLIRLEMKIKNTFLSYCPGDKEEIKKVLKMKDKTNWDMGYGWKR